MKHIHRYSNDLTVNQGWNLRDIAYLREHDPARGPNIQIFAYSEQEDEEPTQDSTIWCKNCNHFTSEYIDALDAYFYPMCYEDNGGGDRSPGDRTMINPVLCTQVSTSCGSLC
jgi:hypothetical protein